MSDTTAPAVEGDFYDLAALLEEEDRLLLKRVRTFMEEHVAPIINVYWGKAEFPFEVLPAMAELGIAGLAYHGSDGHLVYYDSKTDRVVDVANLTELTGESQLKRGPQSKIHSKLGEGKDGRIYFGTHAGWWWNYARFATKEG